MAEGTGLEPARALSPVYNAFMNPKNHEISEQYIAKPNKCLTCDNSILPKPRQRLFNVRQKKFCNNSCAASFNNRLFPKKKAAKKVCINCLQSFSPPNQRIKTCSVCRPLRSKPRSLENTSRQEAGRVIIGKHAMRAMGNRAKVCAVCGYDRFVDVCHIKPVAAFSSQAKLKEINAPENLVYLCPNHHREYDRGLINLNGG
jgi:hypothetical protein